MGTFLKENGIFIFSLCAMTALVLGVHGSSQTATTLTLPDAHPGASRVASADVSVVPTPSILAPVIETPSLIEETPVAASSTVKKNVPAPVVRTPVRYRRASGDSNDD